MTQLRSALAPFCRWALLLLIPALLSVSPYATRPLFAQDDPWWESAAEESREEFDAVKNSLSETISELDDITTKIDDFETLVRGTLTGQDLDDALATINEARTSLDSKLDVMRLADSRLTSVGSAIDGAFDLKEVVDTATARRGGSLATSMSLLGEAMTRYGGEVPWVGDFIGFYGEAVTGLLDATDQLDRSINTNIRQGTLSGLGVDDPQITAIKDQFGEDFLANHTLAPVDIPFLYEDLGSAQGDFTLIWNPGTGQWTRADHSAATIAALYRSYALANGRPLPDQLIALSTTSFDAAQARLAAGEDAFDLLSGLAGPVSNFIFDIVNETNDYELSSMLDDRKLFVARFAHSQTANSDIVDWVRQLYAEALLRGADDVANKLQVWARKHNIDLEPAQEPQLGAVNSIVILFDASGSMGDNGKITAAKSAARNVLTRMDDETQVALIVFYGCGSIRVEQEFTTDTENVLTKIEAISPSGSTPLADGISFAKGYIQDELAGGKTRLVVLSDGEETCGGDPVGAARQ